MKRSIPENQISQSTTPALRARADALKRFAASVLSRIGADDATTDAAARAMLHGSLLGIDSHGVRLLPHYAQVIEGGRVNGRPRMTFSSSRSGAGTLDADNAHGALAGLKAVEHAVRLAHEAGIGAVAVRRSSHFGAAGVYALAAAEAGMIGLATCNSDAAVHLHGSRDPFHGTNPFAFAAPNATDRPWLLDFATSSIPLNRVHLSRSTGAMLPEDAAVDAAGCPTRDPYLAMGLLPLGGSLFGYKGAGLAGLADILSAGLTGMRISAGLPGWESDFTTPRELGHFFMAIDPAAFMPREAFSAMMRHYLSTLRGMTPGEGRDPPMAPGDREWRTREQRVAEGIPIDPATAEAFGELARRFGLDLPF